MKDVFRSWAEKKASEIVRTIQRYPGGPDVWWASIVTALIKAREDGMSETKLGRLLPRIQKSAEELDALVCEAMAPEKNGRST